MQYSLKLRNPLMQKSSTNTRTTLMYLNMVYEVRGTFASYFACGLTTGVAGIAVLDMSKAINYDKSSDYET